MATALRNTLITAAMVVVIAGSLRAQAGDPIAGMGGTQFVVAFPDTTKNTFDARYPNTRYEDKCFLFIYSGIDNAVSIEGVGYSRRGLAIPGGRFTIIDLMGFGNIASAPIVYVHGIKAANTFLITADAPVIVYQYMATKFGAETWTALPVSAWGKEYYAASNPGEVGTDVLPGDESTYRWRNKMFPAEILVIAAYDSTLITIVPTGAVHENLPTSVLLKAGEAYQIHSYVDTLTANNGTAQVDFAGSKITASKPIGVITGNTRAQLIDSAVGLGRNIFKNMYIEWLSPVELHGTEFVYMPMADARAPTGAPGEDPSEKRKAEFVRVYGTSAGQTTGTIDDTSGRRTLGQISQSRFEEVRTTPYRNRAARYLTDKPAQVMMSSAAVVKYGGTTNGFGGYIGAAYDGWGGSMHELVPRSRWSSFAPYYCSTHPAGMEHFINVVTDTAHRNDVLSKSGSPFIFSRRIAGTDLIWGTMSVQPGIDNWLSGRNGATFSGYVYGTLSKGGHEEFRPGAIRPRDVDPPAAANGGGAGDESMQLHPAEYEEYLAIAYAYPLAALLNVNGAGDSLRIGTSSDCDGLTVTIETVNANPVGLSSITLDSAVNAKIVSQSPLILTGATSATVRVGPINTQRDALATIVITDRTSKSTRVAFTYNAERVDLNPIRLNFGVITPGTSKRMTVKASNPMDRSATVKSIRLIQSRTTYNVISPTTFPFIVTARGSFDVIVEATPTIPDTEYFDTLAIELECSTWKVPLNVETSNPCINMGDLDFGLLSIEESRSLPLRICNNGSGVVTFDNPAGGLVVEWLDSRFAMSPAEIERVHNMSLGPDECMDITVSFSSATDGYFTTRARFWSSTRHCRDTSIWIARVSPRTAAPVETGITNSLGASRPNPFTLATDIEYSLARAGHATLVVYNARGERVATLVDGNVEAGAHVARFDAAKLPAGIYHCRLGVDGWSESRTVLKE